MVVITPFFSSGLLIPGLHRKLLFSKRFLNRGQAVTTHSNYLPFRLETCKIKILLTSLHSLFYQLGSFPPRFQANNNMSDGHENMRRYADPTNNRGDNVARYCHAEKTASQKCMWGSEFDHDKCQPFYDAYKECLREWRRIYFKRMWAGYENAANVPPKGVDPMVRDYVEESGVWEGRGEEAPRFFTTKEEAKKKE